MHRRALLLIGFASGGVIALGISLMQPKIHQSEAVISLAFDQGHPGQKQSMDSAFMSWLATLPEKEIIRTAGVTIRNPSGLGNSLAPVTDAPDRVVELNLMPSTNRIVIVVRHPDEAVTKTITEELIDSCRQHLRETAAMQRNFERNQAQLALMAAESAVNVHSLELDALDRTERRNLYSGGISTLLHITESEAHREAERNLKLKTSEQYRLREQILTLSTPSSREIEPLHIHHIPTVSRQRDLQKIATISTLGASAGTTLALLISYLTPKPILTSNH